MATFYINLMCIYVKHSIWNLIIFLADNDEEEVRTSDRIAHDEPNEGMYEEGNKSNLLLIKFSWLPPNCIWLHLPMQNFRWHLLPGQKLPTTFFAWLHVLPFTIISVSIIEPDVVCFPHVNMNIMENVKG